MTISLRVAFFFTLLLATAIAYNQSWGKREKKDALIISAPVYNSTVRGAILIRELSFPQILTSKSKTITYVEVIDHFRNITGGIPSLIAGGPSAKFVTLRFTSQLNYGFDFQVYIYGK